MVLVALSIVAGHVLLSPFTADWQRGIRKEWHESSVTKRSSEFIKALQKSGPACRKDLVPCVLALKEHLTAQRIKLRVVLRPEIESVLTPQGTPQLEANTQAAALMAAEQALRKEDIVTVNLLPAVHRAACLSDGAGIREPNDSHFTRQVIAMMARELEESMKEHQRAQQGRHLMLMGDCYATLITSHLQNGEVLPGARAMWKNAGDTLMAHEISRLPEGSLEGVREIYWCLNSFSLDPASKAPLPLPRLHGASNETGERMVHATLTKRTGTPSTLGKESPYPNALILHEFTSTGGEKMLAVAEIMRGRTVNSAVNNWFERKPYILTLQPWDQAVKENPDLGREQLIDDIQDFEAERYYVKDWSHAP